MDSALMKELTVGNARVATSSGHTEVRATPFGCGKFVGKVFFYSCVTVIGSALVKKLSLVLILTYLSVF